MLFHRWWSTWRRGTCWTARRTRPSPSTSRWPSAGTTSPVSGPALGTYGTSYLVLSPKRPYFLKDIIFLDKVWVRGPETDWLSLTISDLRTSSWKHLIRIQPETCIWFSYIYSFFLNIDIKSESVDCFFLFWSGTKLAHKTHRIRAFNKLDLNSKLCVEVLQTIFLFANLVFIQKYY